MEIIFRQWGICYYGAPSLTRGRVCNLQLLLSLVGSVFLESESRGAYYHILLYQFWDSDNLKGQVPPIYFHQEKCGPVTPPSTPQ
jgi:hypothetical protein